MSPADLRRWTALVPFAGLLVLALTWAGELIPVTIAVVSAALIGSVVAAVHHAEVVAHRVGEPFGSIVLAISVTIIEVGLIVMIMTTGKSQPTLARDTVFAAVMITVNGIAGLALLIGAMRHSLTHFNSEGTGAALTVIGALSTVALVLPTFTSTPGPVFSASQLAFAAVASLLLYIMFVFSQTGRHRDFFLPVDRHGDTIVDDHADPPTVSASRFSLAMLVLALVAVVGLAKVGSPSLAGAVASVGLPGSFVGVLIALIVLAPETLAAARAARRNRLQISLNLAYGSAIASVGLTIPALALASIWLDGELALGLSPLHIVLLAISLFTAAVVVVPGRATRLQGGVHLVLLAAYLFLSAVP